MPVKTLMVQGTGSSVGKSLVVTALCRIFHRKGVRVAPFKSQNMSLNSFITAEGHEMGRAQVAQAEAAGLVPSSLMNPVLLKPTGEQTSQVIVNGRVRTTLSAQDYYTFRPSLRDDIMQSFTTLASQNDLIIIEGAGSPAEINLRENDLANMGMARMAHAPVILVGDIDRGGVFASLYGTVKLLEPDEQRHIKGCIINKFRGMRSILDPGLRQLEDLLDLPVLGVLPYWDVRIDEEDSLTDRLRASSCNSTTDAALDIVVIHLPRLSNFTDFAIFDTLPDVALRYVQRPEQLGTPDLIILPGTKNTLEDLHFLAESGLRKRILHVHQSGVPLIGICGGYQMLGRTLCDPQQTESNRGKLAGLSVLPTETTFFPHKQTVQTCLTLGDHTGILRGTQGMTVTGYEIHMGQTERNTPEATRGSSSPQQALNDAQPLGKTTSGSEDGAVTPDGACFGTYLHGIFDSLPFTRTLINNLRARKNLAPLATTEQDYLHFREAEYNRLADMVEEHLNMQELERIIDAGFQTV